MYNAPVNNNTKSLFNPRNIMCGVAAVVCLCSIALCCICTTITLISYQSTASTLTAVSTQLEPIRQTSVSATETHVASFTETPTSTNTSTSTITPTYTSTSTSTDTATFTSTATTTKTYTPASTNTRTYTPRPLPTNTPVPNTVNQSASCDCSRDSLNCSNFSTWSQAQGCFEQCKAQTGRDVHGLDRDNDNVVCESLR